MSRSLRSSPSSVSSDKSTKSLPARMPTINQEERDRLNNEAFQRWKQEKLKQEIAKRDKTREEQEKLQKDKKEKEARNKQITAENRTKWLERKQLQTEAAKKSKLEAQKKVKELQEERRKFSKESVATWMRRVRNELHPQNGSIFENPCIKFTNPQPWSGILDE